MMLFFVLQRVVFLTRLSNFTLFVVTYQHHVPKQFDIHHSETLLLLSVVRSETLFPKQIKEGWIVNLQEFNSFNLDRVSMRLI